MSSPSLLRDAKENLDERVTARNPGGEKGSYHSLGVREWSRQDGNTQVEQLKSAVMKLRSHKGILSHHGAWVIIFTIAKRKRDLS